MVASWSRARTARRSDAYTRPVYGFFNRALLPHVAFFVLLAAGWWLQELSLRRIGMFLVIWLVASAAVPMLPYGGLWMTALVSVLDVMLILMIFRRDIRIY